MLFHKSEFLVRIFPSPFADLALSFEIWYHTSWSLKKNSYLGELASDVELFMFIQGSIHGRYNLLNLSLKLFQLACAISGGQQCFQLSACFSYRTFLEPQ